MDKKHLILLFSLLFLCSCNNTKTEYHSNGRPFKIYQLNKNGKLNGDYKEFYENGDLKEISIYENGIKIDSSLYYTDGIIKRIDYYLTNDTILIKNFEKGKILSKGRQYKEQKINKWEYYNERGIKDKVFEYINLCGTQYTNQGWYFNDEGDTVATNSNFYKLINFPKKVKQDEVVNFQMYYESILKKSNSFLCLSRPNPPFRMDYCNIEEIKLDTIFSDNNLFNIYISFSTKGEKNLRGFITEFTQQQINKDSAEYNKRKIYFDIPLLVD